MPQDVDDVRKALIFADKEKLPVHVLGGGNNVLVKDRGIRGMVVKLEGCLGRMEFHGEEVTIGGGAGLSTMIREAAALGLGGMECLVGIPATIGGALAMNAGGPDGAIGIQINNSKTGGAWFSSSWTGAYTVPQNAVTGSVSVTQ